MEDYLLPLRTPCVFYEPQLLSESEANEAYEDLLTNTPWEKTAKINRWVTLMELPKDDHVGDDGTKTKEEEGSAYKYRDAPGASIIGFPPAVHKLKLLAEEWYNSRNQNNNGNNSKPVEFNVCLLNYYQDGTQRIGWHSDREELGRSTPIASISLGTPRQFLIRSKTDGVRDRASLTMDNGSMVIMENICQWKYLHSVPKEANVVDGRINLTFRCKDEEGGKTEGEVEHEKRDHWIDQISTEDGVLDSTAGAWKKKEGNNNNDDDVAATMMMSEGGGGKVFGDDAQFYDPTCHVEEQVAKSVEYLVTTNIGAECYCAAELEEVVDIERYYLLARPFGVAGYVAVCRRTSENKDATGEEEEERVSQMEGTLLQLRNAHHVLRYHDHFDLSDLLPPLTCETEVTVEKTDETTPDEKEGPKIGSITGQMLYEYYKEKLVAQNASIPSLVNLEEGGTFRTSCDRIGSGHGFQAPDLEREIGGAMSEYYTHIKPKMLDFDINVRVDVVSTKVIVGTQINVVDLSKQRHFLRFRNAVTIKTNLAYAMIRCGNIKNGDLVVDPFCGSGTILLEALDVYQKQIKCVGMDVSRRSANGAKENAVAEGFGDDVCQFHCCDARNFRRKLEEDSVGAIVTNLPWGVMTGHKNVSDLQSMYEVFLRTAWYILKDKGRIVMLVLRGLQLTRIIRKLSGRYRLISVNCVRTTNNLPSIVVVEKLAVDEVRDAVKRQLGYLAQFVSVSSEMHQAVHYEKIDEKTM
mmetsp:Transcript_14357/g.31114  ORF Transcript_14357/g.31114 Transcript_14357/m.31114 type:complete len:749 (+) Transcript_14357:148-2394(+)|eukprot:CAMPEP_0172315380 /NCGR_PEP_ID=MMETSP1058-20130122/25007_1 /TAXON_ID=83371 /ORGANISM="Detonula confervacea, Strain CCMP 353" /LENGTH=748 /DNA_ID=CAMNT_0013029451 /DNA_START=77 /DNA_END=2323 /DNA_ORIENTATION=+